MSYFCLFLSLLLSLSLLICCLQTLNPLEYVIITIEVEVDPDKLPNQPPVSGSSIRNERERERKCKDRWGEKEE